MDTTTAVTTNNLTTMGAELIRKEKPALAVLQEHNLNGNDDIVDRPSLSDADSEFDDSQCLFCNQMNPDLDRSLIDMCQKPMGYT